MTIFFILFQKLVAIRNFQTFLINIREYQDTVRFPLVTFGLQEATAFPPAVVFHRKTKKFFSGIQIETRKKFQRGESLYAFSKKAIRLGF